MMDLLKNKFIIVDDFYIDPDKVREFALLSEYEDENGGNYPGVMSKTVLWTDEHVKMFKDLTNEPLLDVGATILNGRFRLTKKDDPFRQHIHFDAASRQNWSGVIYLTPPEYYTDSDNNIIDAGTSFWKHKENGLEAIPMTQEGIEKYGWKNVDDLKVFLETDGIDENKWVKTFTVPIKYNRLVLFRPWLFHSSGIQFGTNKQDCRLIQVFFLQI